MTVGMTERGPLVEYLGQFDGLIGDERTGQTFSEVVRGIINAGSLVCQQIAAHSPVLSAVKDGAQRVIRFAKGESTKRSAIDAEHLVAVLCKRGVEQLSEPWEVQRGLKQVSQAVRPLKECRAVSWIVDRGFDDVAVWRTIWEQKEHLVCRIFHTERLVAYQTVAGKWRDGDVTEAQQHLRPMARARTRMVVRRGPQKKEKRQKVTVEIRSCPLRLSYNTHVRREGAGAEVQKVIWLVEV